MGRAPSHSDTMPLASALINAFDDAMGFSRNHLEAASTSMFQAGLEGHALPEKVAMVRQRLDLEQNRLAAGMAAVMANAEAYGVLSCADSCATATCCFANARICLLQDSNMRIAILVNGRPGLRSAGLRKAVEAVQSAKTRRQNLSRDCTTARGALLSTAAKTKASRASLLLTHQSLQQQKLPSGFVVAEEQRALQQQEERAVDAEDFERAADLSARLDALNASMSRLADDLRAAEAECELTCARPLQPAMRRGVTTMIELWSHSREHEPD